MRSSDETKRRSSPPLWPVFVFARSALAVGLGWEAILPLPAAEFRREFSEPDWRDVESLLDRAEHVRVIGERSVREDAYLDGGLETVNRCDVLLAVWSGTTGTITTGCAAVGACPTESECYRLARRQTSTRTAIRRWKLRDRIC